MGELVAQCGSGTLDQTHLHPPLPLPGSKVFSYEMLSYPKLLSGGEKKKKKALSLWVFFSFFFFNLPFILIVTS